MPDFKYKRYSVTGVANVLTYATQTLTSTKEEPKYLHSISVFLTGHIDNIIEVWLERELLAEIPDYEFITDESSGSTNVQKNTNRRIDIEIEKQIPDGQTVQIGLRCGATNKNVKGSFKYEITT